MGGGVILRTSVKLLNPCLNQLQNLTVRCNCSQNALVGSAGQPKMEKISKAVKMYLERAQKHEEFMNEQIVEYEIGKRHLANIMGLDPENVDQEDIDKAVRYLLPSGLFSKKARPMFKHPNDILPKFSAAQFDGDGRPYSSFYYTIKQNFYDKLHTINRKVDELKAFEDQQIAKGVKFDQSSQLLLAGSEWITKENLEAKLSEKVSDQEFKTFILAVDHLSRLPYSYKEKEFVFEFRKNLIPSSSFADIKEEMLFDEEGRGFIEATGQRKKAKANIKLFEKGTGEVTINDEPFFAYFPDLIDREQVLFPLHLVGLLLKVDVKATVNGGGHRGHSGAIRLAIAKAACSLVSSAEVEKLRLAGLLTRDPRTLERMKPGKVGARKKPLWKKR